MEEKEGFKANFFPQSSQQISKLNSFPKLFSNTLLLQLKGHKVGY